MRISKSVIFSGLALMLQFIFLLTSCGRGKEQTLTDGGNRKNLDNIGIRESQIKEADNWAEVARILDLQPVRFGVWQAHDYRFSGRKERVIPPVEVITDPSIVKKVENGLRPDGEKMYSYPDKMPDGYPSKWIKYAIDIFPEKVSGEKSIKSGRLILYGHFIDPPYKIQVVLNTKTKHTYFSGHVLVNGVDTTLKTNKNTRDKMHRNHKGNISPNNKKYFFPDAHQKAMQLLADYLRPVFGEDATINSLVSILKKDVHVRSYTVDRSTMSIQYIILTDGILKYKHDHPMAYEAEKDRYGYLGLIMLRKEDTGPSLGQVARKVIIYAGHYLHRGLVRGDSVYDFGGGNGGTLDDHEWSELVSICQNQKQHADNNISKLLRIFGSEERAMFFLANCGR